MTPSYIHSGRRKLFNKTADQSAAERIGSVPNDILRSLPERDRLDLTMALRNHPEKNDPGLQSALMRLMRNRPYSEQARIHDLNVTRKFYKLWRESPLEKRHPALISPVRAFRAACDLSLDAMDIPRHRVNLTISKTSGAAFGTERDFQPAVGIRVIRHRQGYDAHIKLNNESNHWRWSLSQKRDDIRRIGAYALHEITHLEQQMCLYEKQGKGFYGTMFYEAALTDEFKKDYELYRPALLERQPHYRTAMLGSMFYGYPMRKEPYYMEMDISIERANRTAAALRAVIG